MKHMMPNGLLLLSIGLHLSIAAVLQQPVKYAGPVVYSGLPPPVVYFPTLPKYPNEAFKSQVHIGPKQPVEYIPLPYQDLPVLVYQSKDHPPIHVVSKPDSQKSTSGYTIRGQKGVEVTTGDHQRDKQTSTSDSSRQHLFQSGTLLNADVGKIHTSTKGQKYEHLLPQLATSESYIQSLAVLPGSGTSVAESAPTYSRVVPFQSVSQASYEPGVSFQQDTTADFVRGGTAYIPQTDLTALASEQGAIAEALTQSALESEAFRTAKLSGSKINLISPMFSGGRRYRHFLNSIFRPITYRQQSKLYATLATAFPHLFHPDRLTRPSFIYTSPSVHYQPIYIRNTVGQNPLVYASPPYQTVKGTNDIVEEVTAATSVPHYKQNEGVEEYTAERTPAPHVIYTGHPPIHVFQHPIIVKETVSVEERPSSSQDQVQYLETTGIHHRDVAYGGSPGGGYAMVPASYEEHAQASYDEPNFSDTDAQYQAESSNTEGGHVLLADTGSVAQVANEDGHQQGQLFYSHHHQQHHQRGVGGSGEQYGEDVEQPVYGNSAYGDGGQSSEGGYQGQGIETVVAYTPVAYAPAEESSNNEENVQGHRGYRALIHNLAALGHAMLIRKPVSYVGQQAVQQQQQQKHVQQTTSHNSAENESVYFDHVPSESIREYNYDRSKEFNYPKANYKVPPTAATAAPEHHRPPIIIYKGLSPPVHVYPPHEAEASKIAASTSHQTVEDRTPVYREPLYRQEVKFHPPVPSKNSYPRSPGNQEESYGPSSASSSAFVAGSNEQRVYGAASDYNVYESSGQSQNTGYHTASWVPINFHQYLEAQAISDQGPPENTHQRSDTSPIERSSSEEVDEPIVETEGIDQASEESILSRADTDASETEKKDE